MSEQRNIIIDNIDFSEALRYLGYGNSTPDEKTKEILYNCADQLKSVMEGKYTYKVFDFICRYLVRLIGWLIKVFKGANHEKKSKLA